MNFFFLFFFLYTRLNQALRYALPMCLRRRFTHTMNLNEKNNNKMQTDLKDNKMSCLKYFCCCSKIWKEQESQKKKHVQSFFCRTTLLEKEQWLIFIYLKNTQRVLSISRSTRPGVHWLQLLTSLSGAPPSHLFF